MAEKNDRVFQLSLTEIAFTIIFILLLLLGYLVFKEESARIEAETIVSQVQSAELATETLNSAKETFANSLRKGGVTNTDEVITRLVAAADIRSERDRLQLQMQDLDAKLTAFTELQDNLLRTARQARPGVTKETVDAALTLQESVLAAIDQERKEETDNSLKANTRTGNARLPAEHRNKVAMERVTQALGLSDELKKQLKAQLGKDVKPGEEIRALQEIVADARDFNEMGRGGSSPAAIKKQNADLRGQVAFLKNRLDARGGRDFPPCWADENGKVEFLFSIEMKPDVLLVAPAWPVGRDAAARALPGISEVLEGPVTHQNFAGRIQGIFNSSRRQDPECRHYVQLRSSISDAVQSDRARLMVESYFYKIEVRR